jgi:hypothetical protein
VASVLILASGTTACVVVWDWIFDGSGAAVSSGIRTLVLSLLCYSVIAAVGVRSQQSRMNRRD